MTFKALESSGHEVKRNNSKLIPWFTFQIFNIDVHFVNFSQILIKFWQVKLIPFSGMCMYKDWEKIINVKMIIGADGERANHMAISLNIPGVNIFWSEFTAILLI